MAQQASALRFSAKDIAPPEPLRFSTKDIAPPEPAQAQKPLRFSTKDIAPPPQLRFSSKDIAPSFPTSGTTAGALDPLSKAKAIGAPPPEPSASFLERIRDLGVSAAKGIIGVGESAVGLLDIPTGGRAGQIVDRYGLWSPKDVHAALDTYYTEASKREGLTVRQAEGPVRKAIAALKNPSVIANAVAQSTPLMLGGGGIARTLAAKGAPLAAAAAVGEGAMTAGLTADA